MEVSNQSGKDSMEVAKNSKGYNFSIKVYFQGTADPEDSIEKMQNRMIGYRKFLSDNFPE